MMKEKGAELTISAHVFTSFDVDNESRLSHTSNLREKIHNYPFVLFYFATKTCLVYNVAASRILASQFALL